MACSCTGASTSSSIRPPALAVEAAAAKATAAVKVLIVCIIRILDLRMRVIGHYHLPQKLLNSSANNIGLPDLLSGSDIHTPLGARRGMAMVRVPEPGTSS
jgi:hypothetical protein